MGLGVRWLVAVSLVALLPASAAGAAVPRITAYSVGVTADTLPLAIATGPVGNLWPTEVGTGSAGLTSGRVEAAGVADCLPPPATTQSFHNSGAINWTSFLRPQGPLKAIMLFVDYPDRPAVGSTTDVFSRYVPKAEQWYSAVSYGKVSLSVTPVNTWFRMPRPSTGYMSRANASFTAQRQLIQDAVSAADPTVDFGGYQLIYVVSPSGSGIDYSPGFTPTSPAFGVTADGNTLWHGATLGKRMSRSSWNFATAVPV